MKAIKSVRVRVCMCVCVCVCVGGGVLCLSKVNTNIQVKSPWPILCGQRAVVNNPLISPGITEASIKQMPINGLHGSQTAQADKKLKPIEAACLCRTCQSCMSCEEHLV